MLFLTQNGIFCFRTVETAIDQFDENWTMLLEPSAGTRGFFAVGSNQRL